MPCFSSLVQTRFVNADRLAEALRSIAPTLSHGLSSYEVGVSSDGLAVTVNGRPLFRRSNVEEGFTVRGTDGGPNLSAIGRKYAELGVKAFAKRKGYSIVADDGQRIVLKNRRS